MPSQKKKPLPDITAEAKGRWPGVLAALGFDEKLLTGKKGPCPISGCGGKDRFRFDDKEGRGTWICSQCGAGDGFNLLMKVNGWDFKTAAQRVKDMLPLAPVQRVAKERSNEQKLKALKAKWESAVPLEEGTQAWCYLDSRGIYARSKALRAAVQLPYYDTEKRIVVGHYDAMVARVADAAGKGVSLHVTYLEKGAKAPVEAPKKMMSPVGTVLGASVQLAPVSEDGTLGVAEGIESALSAFEFSSIPTWAALSADGLAAFVWPEGVKRLVIFGDNDDNFAGHKAAYTLGFRARGKGLAVDVRFPKLVGVDWNDLLREARKEKA